MSCTKCGTSNTACGCKDSPYTTAVTIPCQPDANCPTPSKCSEYMDASCVYLNDGIYDAGIEPGTSLEEAVQQLTLLITNPDCTTAPAGCECQGGGGTYSVINGLQPDDTDPNVFKLGGELIEDTTIDGVDNGFILTLSALKAFNVLNAGEILIESLDEIGLKGIDINFYKSSGPRMMGINELLGQLTLDGYYGGTGVLYTDAPAYAIGVDNVGNVFKIPYNTGAGIDPITADNGITANTTTNVRLGGALVQDTTITGAFNLALGDMGSNDPLNEINLHATVINLQTPAIAAATAAPGQVPVLIDDATGEIEFRDAITFTATGSGAATYDPATGALNIPNNPTATPDPPIFATLPGLSTTPAWDPSSFSTSTSNFIYVVPADTAIITGLVPGAARFVDGGLVTIQNGADNALLLIETNPGTTDPTEANRFVSPDGSGIVLMPGKALTFFYNARASRWVDINNYEVSTPFTDFEDFIGLPHILAVQNIAPNYLVNSPLFQGRLGMFNILSTGITNSAGTNITNAGLGAGNVEAGCLGTGTLSAGVGATPNIYLWAGRGQLNAIYSTETYSNPRLFAAKGKVSTSATSLNDFTATVGLTQGVHISIPSALLVGGFSYQRANSSTNWFIYAGTNTPIDTGISAVDSHVGMYIYTGTNLNKVQCITWAPISTLNPAHRWTINNFTTGLPTAQNAQTNAPMISFNRTVGTVSGTYLSIDWAGLVKQKRT